MGIASLTPRTQHGSPRIAAALQRLVALFNQVTALASQVTRQRLVLAVRYKLHVFQVTQKSGLRNTHIGRPCCLTESVYMTAFRANNIEDGDNRRITWNAKLDGWRKEIPAFFKILRKIKDQAIPFIECVALSESAPNDLLKQRG
jgi:hypothetical protein